MSNYLETLFNLQGKTAAITGGGGYLCGEMARSLAKAGVKVAVLDMRLEKAQYVAEEINDTGGTAVGLSLEVTQKEQHQEVLKKVLELYGDLDILINGAGTNAPTPFLEIPLDEWNAILASQITGTMLGCQVFGEYMVTQQKGSIINISSASAGPPLSKAFTYSVAKAGIKNLTQNKL